MPFGDPSRNILDAFGTADRGATVFLDDQCHARNR
jgi:hypothetical protein